MAGAATAEVVIDPANSVIPSETTGAAAAKPPEKKPEPPAAKPEPPAGAAAGKAEPDDDKDPLGVYEKDGKKFVKMPYEAFKDRLKKSTKKALKEIFGTSDTTAILAIKKQFDDFAKDAEERKRAEMSERQKLEADRDAALSAKEVAERRAERARNTIKVAKTDRLVTRAAREHVHGDKLDIALAMFRVELMGMSRRKADKILGKESEWFAAFAEKNPDFAKAARPAVEGAPAKDKKPASNGLDPKVTGKKPTEAAPGNEAKKVKDMTKEEVREFARKNNIKLPQDMQLL